MMLIFAVSDEYCKQNAVSRWIWKDQPATKCMKHKYIRSGWSFVYGIHHLQSIFHIFETVDLHWSEMPFIFLNMVLAMWISTGLLCKFVVLNLSVNGYVLESVLGYKFEHCKQLAFGWLFIIAFTPYWRVPKRTKQLSTVKVAGLVRALTHIGSLINYVVFQPFILFYSCFTHFVAGWSS